VVVAQTVICMETVLSRAYALQAVTGRLDILYFLSSPYTFIHRFR